MPRALFSVSNKVGITEFAHALQTYGWEIVASGGTRRTLDETGVPVTSLEQVTNHAEMLGGRVKTLHPAIHGGILARDDEADLREIEGFGYAPISMVVCNLYPFIETARDDPEELSAVIEQIDIGGVTMLRAAAKNFERVTTICDPEDYLPIMQELHDAGQINLARRRQLALKAFAHTRDYDTAIHAFLCDSGVPEPEAEGLPESIAISLMRSSELRYGENPHQSAAFYSPNVSDLPLGAEQLGGKQLSYNNFLDADAAWRAVSGFNEPTAVIVKHLTPTGIASADSIAQALPQALASDPVSAFGGIIAVNRELDEDFVAALGALFVEVIIAPAFTGAAQDLLRARRRNCRLLQVPQAYDTGGLEIRSVMGGMLLQTIDSGDPSETVMRTVSARAPLDEEWRSLRFAWQAVQHVKSNAIALARGRRTIGIGGGLPSRVDAVELAIKKAGAEATGAALASDAYFPFPDGIEAAARAGVTSVIQPGGSIRDKQVIETADKYDMAMIFTGERHFRH